VGALEIEDVHGREETVISPRASETGGRSSRESTSISVAKEYAVHSDGPGVMWAKRGPNLETCPNGTLGWMERSRMGSLANLLWY
jgi:hypothetical protein